MLVLQKNERVRCSKGPRNAPGAPRHRSAYLMLEDTHQYAEFLKRPSNYFCFPRDESMCSLFRKTDPGFLSSTCFPRVLHQFHACFVWSFGSLVFGNVLCQIDVLKACVNPHVFHVFFNRSIVSVIANPSGARRPNHGPRTLTLNPWPWTLDPSPLTGTVRTEGRADSFLWGGGARNIAFHQLILMLNSGIQRLNSGIQRLNSGIQRLNSGIQRLNIGILQLKSMTAKTIDFPLILHTF